MLGFYGLGSHVARSQSFRFLGFRVLGFGVLGLGSHAGRSQLFRFWGCRVGFRV